MKIVTYNVNGLRSRVSQHGSLLKLLNSLDADIICFQETKLSRQELTVDLTMAEGYEAFVSCTRSSTRGRLGYSGVATFCRVASAFSSSEVALPVAAEEGFTGLLECSTKKEIMARDFLEIPFRGEGLEDITNMDILKVDSEGRCVITDHGHFVLFNLYGPRAQDDNDERLSFKFLFFKILQKRWESLLNEGRRVFVVGDLNIAPAAIDKCDADPDFERNTFREWLRSLLKEWGGSFFDVFRSKHPERKDAYTCFPQNVGGEEFNYGTRIDHILISGPCMHQDHDMEGHNLLDCHVEECDILAQFTRGKAGNASKWKGGRSIKLEGSDHVPVYIVLKDVPNLPVHNTPSLSVRYLPEVRGWQQTIVSFLGKRQTSTSSNCDGSSNSLPSKNTAENYGESSVSTQKFGTSVLDIASYDEHEYLSQINLTSKSEAQSLCFIDKRLAENTKNTILRLGSVKEKPLARFRKNLRKKGGYHSCSQPTLRSFFQQSDTRVIGGNAGDDFSNVTTDAAGDISKAIVEENREEIKESITIPFGEGQEDKIGRDNVAKLEWERIQQKMKMTLPACKGHGEPCIARSVKKGANVGRQFYVCARAKGPASNTEANCDHFQWASVKVKRK